ncbi:hypothetical protein JJQ58_00845 [Mammaliicoccus fleurettii]|uniref:Uncharacterized protein n=2 Tax=Staphylococcaceae TaxID=90964 RepID=A0ABS5MJE7_9STAP|nr:hypothetical protein [Mammaliicoccus fleurettii]MBS3670966.1 hypothetical protein [Mammaliicoccus fleurettii]MBS3696025.1 hypothetical protein [Mammaliicoccus fleurettii]
MEEGQYKIHEVDQIILEDFNDIFAKGKGKKNKVNKIGAGELSPEQILAMT